MAHSKAHMVHAFSPAKKEIISCNINRKSYLLSISMTLLVPSHQPSFLRAAAFVLQRQWAAVRTYLDKYKTNPVADIKSSPKKNIVATEIY